MKYRLQCECGRSLAVTPVQAGQSVICQCGATITVMPLSQLQHCEVVSHCEDSEIDPDDDVSSVALEYIPTENTILHRHMAAIFDNLISLVLGVCVAKSIPNDIPILPFVGFIATYLGYYFVFETLISRTPGKLLTGLTVVRINGARISAREAAIRTVFRILEVNPILLGAIPAALSIVFSRHHQRFGDKFARTIVVPPSRIP